jgi:hypothetical protein
MSSPCPLQLFAIQKVYQGAQSESQISARFSCMELKRLPLLKRDQAERVFLPKLVSNELRRANPELEGMVTI